MAITIPNPPGAPNTPGAGGAALEVNRRMTTAFIAALPVTIVLTPHTRTKTPGGGYTNQAQAPRFPQVMTLIEPRGMQRETVTVDGVERAVEFELLGEWDSQMAVGDTFSHKGKDWTIASLFHENDYERRAAVIARG